MPYIKNDEWKSITDYFNNQQLSYCPKAIKNLWLKKHTCPKCERAAIDCYNTDSDWFQAVHGHWQKYLYGPHDHYRCNLGHTWCDLLPAGFNLWENDSIRWDRQIYYDYADQKLHHYEGEIDAFRAFLDANKGD